MVNNQYRRRELIRIKILRPKERHLHDQSKVLRIPMARLEESRGDDGAAVASNYNL
jgi:hypothetical protein